MPKEGDAVCLAAGMETGVLRAGRRYTVRNIWDCGNIWLNDARTGERIGGEFSPSLLAPATEAECLALHAALYLGREAGVARALLEAHSEVAHGGLVRGFGWEGVAHGV